MKKYFVILTILLSLTIVSLMENGCTASQKISSKTGAQLWGQNCARCHNAPGPGEFKDSNWDVVGQHMRVRANLTGTDTDKIIQFLKGS